MKRPWKKRQGLLEGEGWGEGEMLANDIGEPPENTPTLSLPEGKGNYDPGKSAGQTGKIGGDMLTLLG